MAEVVLPGKEQPSQNIAEQAGTIAYNLHNSPFRNVLPLYTNDPQLLTIIQLVHGSKWLVF